MLSLKTQRKVVCRSKSSLHPCRTLYCVEQNRGESGLSATRCPYGLAALKKFQSLFGISVLYLIVVILLGKFEQFAQLLIQRLVRFGGRKKHLNGCYFIGFLSLSQYRHCKLTKIVLVQLLFLNSKKLLAP